MQGMRAPIATERLVIRPYVPDDAAFLQDLFLDEEGGRYLSDPPRELADAHYFALFDTMVDDPACFQFVAVLRSSGARIGTISCRIEGNTADLGYSIVRDHWGQGYGTEMVRAMVDHCTGLGLTRMTAEVATANTASNSLLHTLGFTVSGESSFTKHGTTTRFPSYVHEKRLARADGALEARRDHLRRAFSGLAAGELAAATSFAVALAAVTRTSALRTDATVLWLCLLPLEFVLVQGATYWFAARSWVKRSPMPVPLRRLFTVLTWLDPVVLLAGAVVLAVGRPTAPAAALGALCLAFGVVEYVNDFGIRVSYPWPSWVRRVR